MKIGIVTFHAAHNFGSMLQAYALKNYISTNVDAQVEIINFRTDTQKDIYSVITHRKGIKYLIKNIYSLSSYRSLKVKHDKFEKFLQNKLGCSEECNTSSEINDKHFDLVIAGSDQIWNLETNDFEWIYFLEGINAKKISYAASCGPTTMSPQNKERVSADLQVFDAISVRDNATQIFVGANSNRSAEIVCDPVLLWDREKWIELSKESSIELPDKYIFFYTLSCNDRMKKIVQQISDSLKLPVVVPHNTNQYDLLLKGKRKLETGPIEFLHMINSASVVITSSFHAMLFSLIFNKQFYIIDGMTDNRKKNLLAKYNLQNQSLDDELNDETLDFIKNQFRDWNIDFSDIVATERTSGEKFLGRNIVL